MATIFSPWKKCLLTAYYIATGPQRRQWHHAAAAAGRAPAMVVFYHRVADRSMNDWTISTRAFTRQIDWLQRHFDLVSLEETQRRLRDGNTRPSVSITFDDGYADNCEFALPLLISRRIPLTYFVASDFVTSGNPFPHDCAAGRPLAPNSLVQLRSLVSANVAIGAHTRTHADLGKIVERDRLRDEIVGSRVALQNALGCAVRYFAFPFGQPRNLQAAAFHLAREAGFAGVCSAYGGYNVPGDDPFHLQRIHADPEFIRFKNWLTVDRRKLRGTQRYQYQNSLAGADGFGANGFGGHGAAS